MNFKKNYAFLAGIMALTALITMSGVTAMQQQSPVQTWYQSQIHNSVKKLNTSFAYLIGSAQDFESPETITQHVAQTKKDLANLQILLKKFNWCPGLLDKAFKQIDDKLVCDPKVAWTGSYVITHLGEQFALAHDMKNWLLAICDQSDAKKQSVEYGKLQLMWLKKDYLATSHSIQEEEKLFKQSPDYVVLQYLIATKKNNQELSWSNELRLFATSALGGNLGDTYKEELLEKEIQELEDESSKYTRRLKKAYNNYLHNAQDIRQQKVNHLQGACKQVNSDEIIFKSNGKYNEFFEIIWDLCNVKSRQCALIGEQFLNAYDPEKLVSQKVASFVVDAVNLKTEYPGIDESQGQKIVNFIKIIDTIVYWRDIVRMFPAAPAVAAKTLSVVLDSPTLCTTAVNMGLEQSVIDVLVNIKTGSDARGLTVHDILKISTIVGDEGLALAFKICLQAIARNPEVYADYFDMFFEGINTWIDTKGETVFSSAKTACDDHELLTYVAMANKNNMIAPIHIPKPVPVVTQPTTLYDSIVNKTTLTAVLGLGAAYAGYRSGAHTWIMNKAKDVDVKKSLMTLGSWVYAYAPGFLK